MSTTLQGLAVLEKDTRDNLIAWSFPTLDRVVQDVVTARSGLSDSTSSSSSATAAPVESSAPLEPSAAGAATLPATFRYSRFQGVWHYMISVQPDTASTSSLSRLVVIVFSQTYNPEKYFAMLNVMSKLYLSAGSPVLALKAYLQVFTKSKVEPSPAFPGLTTTFNDADFDNRRATIAPVRRLISHFGIESILVWVAMLLKKRVFIYHTRVAELQQFVRACPLLGAWHRQNFDILRPLVTLGESEAAELAGAGVYVAGCLDASCVGRRDLYDLFIDVPNKSIVVNDSSKGDFVLTKFHKTTADTIMQGGQSDNDQAAIKIIAAATKQLLDNVQSLVPESTPEQPGVITLELLQSKKLPNNMDKFIYNVAIAEGLTAK